MRTPSSTCQYMLTMQRYNFIFTDVTRIYITNIIDRLLVLAVKFRNFEFSLVNNHIGVVKFSICIRSFITKVERCNCNCASVCVF